MDNVESTVTAFSQLELVTPVAEATPVSFTAEPVVEGKKQIIINKKEIIIINNNNNNK